MYQNNHEAVLKKNSELNALVFHAGLWWLNTPELIDALKQVKYFMRNVDHNFNEQSLAYQQINSETHRAQRKKQITDALMNYRAERDAWDRLF